MGSFLAQSKAEVSASARRVCRQFLPKVSLPHGTTWLLILQAPTPALLAHQPWLVIIQISTQRKEGVSPGPIQLETFTLSKEWTHGCFVKVTKLTANPSSGASFSPDLSTLRVVKRSCCPHWHSQLPQFSTGS